MTDLEHLTIIEACRALIHHYAYLNDERDYEALVDLFTSDAQLFRPSKPLEALTGRAAIRNAFQTRPEDAITFHLVTDVVIDVISATQAQARSRILLLQGTRGDQPGIPDPSSIKPALPGTFRDELVLTETGWKFAKRAGRLWI